MTAPGYGVGVGVPVGVAVAVAVVSGVFVAVGGMVAVGVATPEIEYTRLTTSPGPPIKPRSVPLYVILRAEPSPVKITTWS